MNKEKGELVGVILNFIFWIIAGPALLIVCWAELIHLCWIDSIELIDYVLPCTFLLYSQNVFNKGIGENDDA
jgi:hypothetical protein